MQRSTRFATYVTWEELAGSASTLEQLRQDLRKLPKLQFMNACALVNTVLRTWEGSIDLNEHERLLQTVLSDEFAVKLNKLAREGNPPRFMLHRQQLLFLMKEAAVYSRDDIPDLEHGFGAAFAQCCLKANDLLHYDLAFDPNTPYVERLLPEMVAINDLSSRESMLRKIARTRIMLEEITCDPSIQRAPSFLDIPTLFSKTTGLTVREYSNLVFALLAKYLKGSLAQYNENRELFVTSARSFMMTSVPEERTSRFFEDMALTLSEMQRQCASRTTKNDYTPFRDRPLLKVSDDRYIPLDIGFVVDKLETGVFWRVHFGALKTKHDRDNLHAFWGHLLHQYVSQLMQDACRNSPNRFQATPEFDSAGEACDGVVACGQNAIFMECKGSMLTAEAKYSGSPDRLISELEAKFVGTEETPKGARQLAHSIEKYGNKKMPEGIRGLGRVATIFPVIVARDISLTSPLVNRYLNRRFKTLYTRKELRPVVAPLFILSIDELEQISPYLVDIPFDEILEAKYSQDRSQGLPFAAVHNKRLESVGVRVNQKLEDKFGELIDDTCRDLFGRPFKDIDIDKDLS